MPTFNWATVLPYSIGSALRQTMPDFELLVIGDGCTDESEEVVRGIGDPRVQWINLPANTGSQAGPNNEGLKRARAAHIAYLGHDDLWLPDHLRHLLAAAQDGTPLVHGLQLRIEPEAAPYIAPRRELTYQAGFWIPPTSFMHQTRAARSFGGWRFPKDCGGYDPESYLCMCITAKFGMPKCVPHVTSIKFPAVRRRDVYRLRPHHEQERWTRRILDAPDPEQAAREATKDPVDASLGPLPVELKGEQPESAAERHAMRRRIKGLEGGNL